MRLKRSGSKVSVSTYETAGSSAGTWTQHSGTINGNKITFGYGQRQGTIVTYTGTITGDTIKGSIIYTDEMTRKSEPGGSWSARKK